MDFIYIRSFIEVARCHSFTKAAENLGYVQSSVTTHIQKLEQEYGVVLFERFGRSMRLTSAGEQLRDTFEQILTLYESSKHLISRPAKGHLDIGTIESLFSYFLPPVFNQYRRVYPEINLQVHPITETQILQLIKAGEIDLGIVLDQPIHDEDIEAIKLREEELVLVASPGHRLQQAVQVCAADLNGQSYIATEHTCTYRNAFEKLLGKHGVAYDVHHEFGSLEAIKQCVSYGLGIGLLPRIAVVRELAEGRLIRLPFSHPDITFYTQIVIHRKKWRDPAIRHMMELLREAAGRDGEGEGEISAAL
ncbi:LysR family transcriptional regulator [Cohnella sp. GbtcB17]|uniref:LysR family transcriptional regulator n=1 Tax=Cohnella sp. GbtcB17 TaxID=2824762 RepID=UPI001C2F14A9